MKIGDRLDKWHFQARSNKWLYYFSVFCRIALAIGFVPPGLQKIFGERFTVLSVNHPMGSYLDAFFHTGYYYPFVGYMQVIAGVLLLIPRTATIGAFIYLPIILNICILSFAVRFDGSFITSPLMVCAVLYLLCWDFHKFKNIFPFNYSLAASQVPSKKEMKRKFPFLFFASVFTTSALIIAHPLVLYDIVPRNTISECKSQCEDKDINCIDFCDCIHKEGKSLSECLEEYNNNFR